MSRHIVLGALCAGVLSLFLIPVGFVPLAAGAVLGYRCAAAADQIGRDRNEDRGGTFSKGAAGFPAGDFWTALRKRT